MPHRPCAYLVAIVASAARLGGAEGSYQTGIEEWRVSHERAIRSENGPLLLTGRHDVPEGRTSIGSGPGNQIVLPDRAPKEAGVFTRQADTVSFEAASGVAATLNGEALRGPAKVKTVSRPNEPDRIAFGDFEILVTAMDGTWQMVVRDRQSPYRKAFRGTEWYPVNAGYRVEADYTPYAAPKEVKIPDTAGRRRTNQAPGLVTFRLNGELLRLEPVISGKHLFFMFKDRTAGRETYGAGRYLESEMPKDGKVVLDFNKAYNPYCAVNPYSSCPITPKHNTLMTRVEAGEKYRAHE
jgi:uncharacterized protein (DUF1684 family)